MSHRRVRVLITIDAVGGVWQYGLDLARGLAARGVGPVLALLGPAPDEARRRDVNALSGVRFIETGLPLDWLCGDAAPVLAAGARVAELAREVGADLVQLNMPTLAAGGRFTVPVVAVTHGCVGTWWQAARPSEPLDPALAWHERLTAEGLAAADRVVAPSTSHARAVAAHYGLEETPGVVHNGRAPLVSVPSPIPADRVLTVGRLWDQVKRTALLDRVAARLSVPFAAAGPATGPHAERIELAHLHPLGQLDEAALARELAARPVFVSAASFEPFGLAVLEAASAGCALVLSDIATFRELWDGAALFVAGDDEHAYAEAIQSLIDDPALRERLGRAARERAARYTPAAMADGMLAIYRDLIAERADAGKVAA